MFTNSVNAPSQSIWLPAPNAQKSQEMIQQRLFLTQQTLVSAQTQTKKLNKGTKKNKLSEPQPQSDSTPSNAFSHFWKSISTQERQKQELWQQEFEQKKQERGIEKHQRVPLRTAIKIEKEIDQEHPELGRISVRAMTFV